MSGKLLVVFAFLLSASFLPAQAVDTVEIHRPLLFGIRFHKCMKIWFPRDGVFSHSIVTRQDHIIANDTSYYFKVYGYTGKLLLEGLKGEHGEMTGEVKFYYKSGNLKRTEFYRPYEEASTDTVCNAFCDGTNPWGLWNYYDRKGRLRKTVSYSCDKVRKGDDYFYFKTITTYGKKGKVISTKKVAHHFCEP